MHYGRIVLAGFEGSSCGGGGRRQFGAGSGGSFWSERQHSDPVGSALAGRRPRSGASDGGRPPFTFDQAPGDRADAGCPATRSDDWGNPDCRRRQDRPSGWGRHDLPFLCSPQDHAKKKSLHASEQTRPDVAEARHDFIKRQPSLDPERLIFLDETAASTKMIRTHGRCARGLRLVDPVPHGHWNTSTLVMGLTLSGVIAPYVMDGAMNGRTFLAYVQQMLAPALKAGDILVLDNVAFHKVAGVREAIEARGARVLYLPPYSPDLNPIEQAFFKIKEFLRKEGARAKETLWCAIGKVVDDFKYELCLNLFKKSGYAT